MSRRDRNNPPKGLLANLPGPWRLLSMLGTALGALGAGIQLRREWLETRHIKEGRVYSLAEAAALLRVEEGQLLEDALQGHLPSRTIGDRRLVLGDALLEYMRGDHS